MLPNYYFEWLTKLFETFVKYIIRTPSQESAAEALFTM